MFERNTSDTHCDSTRIAALIQALGDESFQVRTKAQQELQACHDAAEPLVRKKLTEPVTLEVRRRLEQVLEKIDQWSAKHQGGVRAVEVLEHIASLEARQLLRQLSGSEASPRLAGEARAALRRLELKEKS